jgi:hypothetical protein
MSDRNGPESAPDAQELLSLLPQQGESNAYYYLMGALAPESVDPIVHGKKIYESYVPSESLEPVDDSKQKLSSKTLTLPDGDLFCRVKEEGCIKSLFSEGINIGSIIDENSLILERYSKFRSYDDYSVMTTPAISEPLPAYHFITVANRLIALSAIGMHFQGDSESAIQTLVNSQIDLSVQYQQYDELIGKMIVVHILSEYVDLINIIARRSGITPPTLSTTNIATRDLDGAWAREFALSYNTYLKLDRRPDFFEDSGSMPGWVVRVLFKPNMTANAIYPSYRFTMDNAKLPHAKFSKITQRDLYVDDGISLIRNIVGTSLSRVGAPNYDEYSARVLDLEAKVALYHELSGIGASEIESIQELKNPYYPDDKKAFIIEDDYVCLKGPLPDERRFRCLRI